MLEADARAERVALPGLGIHVVAARGRKRGAKVPLQELGPGIQVVLRGKAGKKRQALRLRAGGEEVVDRVRVAARAVDDLLYKRRVVVRPGVGSLRRELRGVGVHGGDAHGARLVRHCLAHAPARGLLRGERLRGGGVILRRAHVNLVPGAVRATHGDKLQHQLGIGGLCDVHVLLGHEVAQRGVDAHAAKAELGLRATVRVCREYAEWPPPGHVEHLKRHRGAR